MSIETVVHDKRKRDIVLCIVLVAGVFAFWISGFDTSYFRGKDPYDYAQMGREISRGHGFSTLQIFPRHVAYMDEIGCLDSEDWPNLYRYPLPVLSNALFQVFIEDTVRASMIQSGIWLLLSLPLLYFLACRLANITVALLCVLFFLGHPVILRSGYDGMSESLATFILLCLVTVVFIRWESWWKWFLAGIFCGLAFLTRTQLVFLFPLLILYILFTRKNIRPARAVVMVFLGLIVTLGPWMLRNIVITGHPFFSFSSTRNLVVDIRPGNLDPDLMLHAPISLAAFINEYGSEIVGKIRHNLWPAIVSPRHWFGSIGVTATVFTAILFISLFRKKAHSPSGYSIFRWGVALLFICNFLSVSVAFHKPRFYSPVIPFLLIAGISEIDSFLVRSSRKYGPAVKWIGIILLIITGALHMYQPLTAYKRIKPDLLPEDIETFARLVRLSEEDCVIASDVSHKVVMYTGRRSLRLPLAPEDLLEINSSYLSLDYVLLTRELISTEGAIREKYREYADFVSSPAFLERYELVERLPNGSVLFRKRICPPEVHDQQVIL